VQGTLDDAAVAAGLLWPENAEACTLKHIQAEVLPHFALRLPPLQSFAAASACRRALLTFAVMEPLRALLSARGMLQVWPKAPGMLVHSEPSDCHIGQP
jgi:hypothetical protein